MIKALEWLSEPRASWLDKVGFALFCVCLAQGFYVSAFGFLLAMHCFSKAAYHGARVLRARNA